MWKNIIETLFNATESFQYNQERSDVAQIVLKLFGCVLKSQKKPKTYFSGVRITKMESSKNISKLKKCVEFFTPSCLATVRQFLLNTV